ncbi:uncharacterized protein LOC129953703 [Eupeodes corollae]|uniref:uncharacterized protein LOC129953703 n=1 Tax=Eupeodes corollae TaxID=290404 RepID=UPI00249172D5|nr:uncharacterized protein LOC129953703 [Eupeodes corollae]
MSSSIPPFVCNTPPPIDCIADAPPPLVEDDFGDFAIVDDHHQQFEVSSLPVTPVHVAKLPDPTQSTENKTSSSPPLPDTAFDFPSKEINNGDDDDGTIDTNLFVNKNPSLSFYPPPNSTKTDVKNDLPYIIEANSPPPFEYEPEEDEDVDLPPCVDLDDDEEPEEFPAHDDMGKYDDNISLPSLKFDSLSNHSKSTTPVSEELTKPKLEEPETILKVDDVADMCLEVNPVDVVSTPDEELNSVPIETLKIADELEKYGAGRSGEEPEDDFAEFEAFPAPAIVVPSEIANTVEVKADDDLEKQDEETIEENITEPVFEADFSQFSSFATEAVAPQVTAQTTDNIQPTEKSNLDDLEVDDFDDFQDFSVPTTATEPRKASVCSASSEMADDPTETSKHSEEDDEDDDFGEFSEVVETNEASSIPSSNSGFNLANLNDKLKPILEMMFPVANPDEQENVDEEGENSPPAATGGDLSKLTAIKQIDTAKALEHQWINSEVRHSLIKSLGVDSRNILYGEKWNSSMPRFAANLSFNPLEPMKPEKSSKNSTTTDYRNRSDSQISTSASASTTAGKTDVPAVEFDWNSSGLVNPLDGVKEILHERTIETLHTTQSGEPNASSDQQPSAALKSNNIINNNTIYDSNDKSLRCYIDSGEETIPAPIEFKSNADAPVAISTTSTAATIITASTALSGDYADITCGEFQPSVLETNLDAITTTSHVLNHKTTNSAKYQEGLKTDLETESQHSGVVSTSTYAGPLKETHIFTPSKGENALSSRSSAANTLTKTPRTSESKCPIDFDYEIAAAGIIIDETVVKKEYRDVEYNPGFGSKYREETIEHSHRLSPDIGLPKHIYLNSEHLNSRETPKNPLDDIGIGEPEKSYEKKAPSVPKSSSFDDEFSDFQSVPAPALPPASAQPTIVPSSIIPSSSAKTDPKTSPSHWRVLKETAEISSLSSRTGTPVSLNDEMILCPAILLPQAIQMESKPKIEWPEPGINPEELARIEELFPQPKGSSNKPSPSHSVRSQQQTGNNRNTPQLGADDDDWSDFVSVPAAPSNHIQSISQQFQKRQVSPAKTAADLNNDDEWSDFVSSAPPPQNNMRPSVYPQFNSASWQNANFYNNPMSAYASPPTSFYYQPPAPQQNLSNNLVPNLSNINNNTALPVNNNVVNNNSINQYLINNQANHLNHHHQQHIQMMRDFSSASPMDGGSLSSAAPSMHHQYSLQAAPGYGYNRGLQQHPHQHQQQQHGKSSQFGSGSSKIAPSISLIPDLGFVAPAHTSFISVPKNSFATKK